MPITLGKNIASLGALRKLGETTDALSRTYERLSSGQRINRASDDAAGLSIALSLQNQSRVLNQASRNINDGFSLLAIADGALSSLSDISTRISELAEQGANGVYSDRQRASIDKEAQALRKEFNRIVESTSFNGINLLDGSAANLSVQVGLNSSAESRINIGIDGAVDRYVGDGTFGTAAFYSSLGRVMGVAAGDLNNDGIMDLVTQSDSGSGTALLLNNGDGTFNSNSAISGLSGEGPALGDFNRDGLLDVVHEASGNLFFRRNNGGSFTGILVDSGLANGKVLSGDINGDGIMDITYNLSATSEIFTYLGRGDGTFSSKITQAKAATSSNGQLSDVDGNGIVDFVYNASTNIYVQYGTSSGLFSSAISTTGINGSSTGTLTGDVNYDGVTDFLQLQTGVSWVALGNASGTWAAPVSVTSNVAGVINSGIADLNGDGYDDIVRASTGGFVNIHLSNGDGTFAGPLSFNSAAVVGSIPSVTLADLNGDGVNDIALGGFTLGGVSVLLANATESHTLEPISLRTIVGSRDALTTMSQVIGSISAQRGSIGAHQSRLSSALQNTHSLREGLSAAESRIRDVDVASEAAELVRKQILQKVGTAILAQANQEPALVLTLLNRRT